MEKIQQIMEAEIRPALQAHNGDIEFIEMTSDGFAKVRLTGACATCPGAEQTMSELVEGKLKEVYPSLKGVISVYQVSDDLINQALQILRKGKG